MCIIKMKNDYTSEKRESVQWKIKTVLSFYLNQSRTIIFKAEQPLH